MFAIKSLLFGLLIICFALNLYSQHTIREKDCTINYQGSNVEMIFDVAVVVNAFVLN